MSERPILFSLFCALALQVERRYQRLLTGQGRRLYFNRLLSNGRSKAAILGDIEQAACASEVIQRMHPYECQ